MAITYRAGIDIGSTTVKLAILDSDDNMIFGEYRRHYAHIQETLAELLRQARDAIGPVDLRPTVTGSGSINLAKHMGIGFVQEVVAVATALEKAAPQTDVAIELGGEDAKIIYFTGGLDQRMNGVCAGGTGSFIDQMAALLQTDAEGLNRYAKDYKVIYPIAARCGVFAKSDIQPLINEGATLPDLSASIFQAVVNQTISGLACGKPIRGNVAFLGGPLHFMTELKTAFIRTLKLTPEQVIDPDNSHLFAAVGSALAGETQTVLSMDDMISRLETGITMDFELLRLDPLFATREDYEAFQARHAAQQVKKGVLADYTGNCYLGIDAGSTTTKLALIGQEGELLWSFYSANDGSPIRTAIRAMADLGEKMPATAKLAGGCSTGYGEALMKSAFMLDEGEVETIAHYYAAAFFDPQVDCILDIGGQDMKCIKIKNDSVDTILLNEACSSGCGSFIENFANSLGYTAAEFAQEALFAKNPIDLGTRCTVFMNSNVKQAQKEGATVQDISAGLAYSVIKNALFKVIKLSDAADLGTHVVTQGGTFYNQAVLRAFELVSGCQAICPDISGIMGAFGAALIAKERMAGKQTTMLSVPEILALQFDTATTRCGRCSNNCMLTITKFPGGRRHITGNRCEMGLGGETAKKDVPNMYAYKLKRIFDAYPSLPEAEAPRGVIGIPRVLNMYENFPYWATFFKELGFAVKLSPLSTRKLYELGMDSIPSESECYPAKLAHGHIQWLIDQGIHTIFHPCVFYERQEHDGAQNHFNCPIVVSYAENLKNNVDDILTKHIQYLRPFIAFTNEKIASDRLVRLMKETFGISAKEVRQAAQKAWDEMTQAKEDVLAEGRRVLEWVDADPNRRAIVLAGRPYHVDPEINHGIPEMINSYGLAVLSEDSVSLDHAPTRPLRVTDQWSFHSRLYTAAEFTKTRNNVELIQLNSFGCGLDAVTTDQVAEILEQCGKLYTVLKIDEVNNLGAARIRLRSLLAAMRIRNDRHILPDTEKDITYERVYYTQEMQDAGYTIIAPQMSPIHFELMAPVLRAEGLNIVVLDNDNRAAIDTGLKYVNNDACFPSLTSIGQIMEAVLSGRYDTDRLAIIMTQTGGLCRASNYIAFIRRALEKCNLGHIPVISLNAGGMESNPGFKLTVRMGVRAARAAVLGDLLMRCLYRVRPYEKEPGSANALHAKLRDQCIASLTKEGDLSQVKTGHRGYVQLCRRIVQEFDELPVVPGLRKPRVGIVGEILVKYMPLANNHLVEVLEQEGAEAVVPDLLDFFNYFFYNANYKTEYLGASKKSARFNNIAMRVMNWVRKPAMAALSKSKRFGTSMSIQKVAEFAKPFLSLGNQYGEGWFLAGEMVELIHEGVPNIVCIQPFACLPNHVVGKGIIKALKREYPQSNIVAVDYDPGASEVNQLNRIKLMLSTAKKNLEAEMSGNAPDASLS